MPADGIAYFKLADINLTIQLKKGSIEFSLKNILLSQSDGILKTWADSDSKIITPNLSKQKEPRLCKIDIKLMYLSCEAFLIIDSPKAL